MSVFSELLKLYKKGSSLKTPMEDFCTESLAGILRSDAELLQRFAEEILQLPSEESYNLKTQKNYYSDTDGKSIVDMVFESGSTLCFLEMKVHASEGYRQLERYSKILLGYSNKKRKNVYLRYCTLYHDEKKNVPVDVKFQQFRWAKIAKFLENQIENNQLINEFYQFLKENKMAGNERFTYEDVIGLKNLNGVFEKVNGIFNEIKEPLSKFGNLKGGISTTSQITVHGRLSIYCEKVIGNHYSEVLVGFQFSGEKPGEGPLLMVHFGLTKENDSYDSVKKAYHDGEKNILNKIESGTFKFNDNEWGVGFIYEKPLADFLEIENQFSSITEWIIQCLSKIDDFKKNHPEFGWNK